jgi:hypothetical protein
MSPESVSKNEYEPYVTLMVVGQGKDTFGAVGVNVQVPVHVKFGVYESACALGAPMTANKNNTGTIPKPLRMFNVLSDSREGILQNARKWLGIESHDHGQSTMLKTQDLPMPNSAHSACNSVPVELVLLF